MDVSYKFNNYVSIDEVKIILEEFRKALPERHTLFVNEQLKKEYDKITNTVVIGNNKFIGTFKESSERKNNKGAYCKEAKMATIIRLQ